MSRYTAEVSRIFPQHMKDTRAIGERGEKQAADFLMRLGYVVLARNFHAVGGEVDLVCRDGDEIVFVEVKLRHSNMYGSALEAATPRKLARVLTAGIVWLEKNHLENADYRVDVVAIDGDVIEHVKNVSA